MVLLNLDLKNITYIQSEAEFNRARAKGFWEFVGSVVTRRSPHLLPFEEVTQNLQPGQPVFLGLQDIPIKDIVGSTGRQRDFTRRFFPAMHDERGKERWRTIYTLAVCGTGFPPVELYQIGTEYFVQNGHHRISVASYLGWPTIQAYVTVLSWGQTEMSDSVAQPN